MAKRTIVEKAGETVGVGIEMASDMAGVIKTAIDGVANAVTGVLKKAPAKKAAKKAVAKKANKKAPPKKVGKKVPAARAGAKKSAKRSTRKPARKTGRPRG